MSDPSIVAAYRRGLARDGQSVTVQRVNGIAPRTALVSATVVAKVSGNSPDIKAASRTGYNASEAGSITQGDRAIVLLEADLAVQRFPLPVQKGDNIILDATGEKLNVIEVDAGSRHLAGALDIKASGVT